MKRLSILALVLLLSACATPPPTSNNNSSTKPGSEPTATKEPTGKTIGDLKEGEASGMIVTAGETVPLKFAYAGHSEMFDEDAIAVLVTDTPMSPEGVAKAFEKYGQLPTGVRGLEYKIGKGFWVRFNPGGFQTSGINTLTDYSAANGVVKGRDEDSTSFDGKIYKRSVVFTAPLPEKK